MGNVVFKKSVSVKNQKDFIPLAVLAVASNWRLSRVGMERRDLRNQESLPVRIDELETEQAKLHAAMAAPDFYRVDAQKI